MSLKSRLERLEQHAPLGGEQAFVRVIEWHIDALFYVYRCACGDPWWSASRATDCAAWQGNP
jgi:hypothetical protein